MDDQPGLRHILARARISKSSVEHGRAGTRAHARNRHNRSSRRRRGRADVKGVVVRVADAVAFPNVLAKAAHVLLVLPVDRHGCDADALACCGLEAELLAAADAADFVQQQIAAGVHVLCAIPWAVTIEARETHPKHRRRG